MQTDDKNCADPPSVVHIFGLWGSVVVAAAVAADLSLVVVALKSRALANQNIRNVRERGFVGCILCLSHEPTEFMDNFICLFLFVVLNRQTRFPG